mgnify:CR=1 FL=1
MSAAGRVGCAAAAAAGWPLGWPQHLTKRSPAAREHRVRGCWDLQKEKEYNERI